MTTSLRERGPFDSAVRAAPISASCMAALRTPPVFYAASRLLEAFYGAVLRPSPLGTVGDRRQLDQLDQLRGRAPSFRALAARFRSGCA